MGSGLFRRGVRLVLLISILVICGMTISSFVARQRLRRSAPPLPAKIAAGIDQQTQSFSLSKSFGGQALYKIQASQVTNFKDTGKTILHDVSIEIYGKKGDRQDHITSQECEFDALSGALYIPGKVDMQLQAPSGMDAQDPVHPRGPIEVQTRGLRFNQNTGIVSTDQEVQFRFSMGDGSSQGAIYNPQDGSITLLANARFNLWKEAPQPLSKQSRDPGPHGSWARDRAAASSDVTHVSTGSLQFRHGDNKVHLTAPVDVVQGTQRLHAGDTDILLDEQGHAQSAAMRGGVHGADTNPLRLFEIEANQADLDLTVEGKVRHVVLEGPSGIGNRESGIGAESRVPNQGSQSATWASSAPRSIKVGQAKRMEMYFDEAGQLSRLIAGGQVRVVMRPAPAGVARALPLLPTLLREDDATRPGSRIISAQQAEMDMAGDGETLREVRTRSSSVIQMFPSKTGEEKRTVQGENFVIRFDPGGEPAEFDAEQNVRVVTEGAGRNRTSTSAHLWAAFDSRTRSVSQMRQWGQFQYQDPNRQARSERADYSADGDVILLQGDPLVWNPTQKITANIITLRNTAGELNADQNVSTTYFPPAASASTAAEPVHVTAQRMQYRMKAEKARYEGNARLWQGSNVIEAGVLELDRQQQTVVARDRVYSIFPGQQRESGIGNRESAPNPESRIPNPEKPVEIRSKTLVYRDQERRAVYEGDVRMHSDRVAMASQVLEVFFAKPSPVVAPTNRSPGLPISGGTWEVERAVATRQVTIVQPERKARGERAEYLPGESKIVLTGNLAAISDTRRGDTQGTRLTYFIRDDRILVQGEPGSPAETRRQVQH